MPTPDWMTNPDAYGSPAGAPQKEPEPFSPEDLARYGVAPSAPFARPQEQQSGASFAQSMGLMNGPAPGGQVYTQAGEKVEPPKGEPKEEKKGFREGENAQAERDASPQLQMPQYQAPGWHPNMYPEPMPLVQERIANVGREEMANRNMLAAEQAQMHAQARQMDLQTQAAEASQQMATQRADEQRARIDAGMKDFQRLSDDAVSGKVDPNRYMHDQSTGSRILMAIGAGLGGFVNAKTGAPNAMLDMVQKNIDRDISAQEHALASKKWRAGQAQNMLGELRAQGLDERQAQLQLQSAQWRIAEEKLKAIAMQSQDPITQAKAEMMSVQMQNKRNEIGREYYRSIFSKGGYSGGELGTREAGLETPYGQASSGAESEKLKELASDQRDYQEKLESLKGARTFGNLISPFNNELDTKHAQAFQAWLKANHHTRITPEMEKQFEREVGGAKSWSPSASERIDLAEEASRSRERNTAQSHLVSESNRGYVRDAHGRVVRASALTGRDATGAAPRASMPKTMPNEVQDEGEE